MSQVWKTSPLTGSALLIELALADFASDEGIAWPAVGTLADKARCSEEWVHQIIRRLRTMGRLEIEQQGGGRNKTNVYRLRPTVGENPVLNTPYSDTETLNSVGKTLNSVGERVKRTLPDPSLEPSTDPSSPYMAEPLPFEPKDTVSPEFIKDMIANYPMLNVPLEWEQYTDHWLAHPKNKPKNDQAGFRNWLRKAETWRNERGLQTTGRNTTGRGVAGTSREELLAGYERYAAGEGSGFTPASRK